MKLKKSFDILHYYKKKSIIIELIHKLNYFYNKLIKKMS